MASVKFLKAEAGQQSVFGTAVSPTFQLPFEAEYEDAQQEHAAGWDSGTWTPVEIVEQVATHARFRLRGTAFFELLPVFFIAGFADMTPSGSYIYTGATSTTAVGAPRPYTFRFGATGNNIGGTGPAVQIADAYLESITLAGNINSKEVTLESQWFGKQIDDNSGAGYAFIGSALPSSIAILNTVKGALALKDATTTGGSFSAMTSVSGALTDWGLTINTGLRPKWRSDSNQTTFSGVQWVEPSVEFTPTIVTDSTTYGLVRTKYNARTYQELMLTLSGASSRAAVFKLTGRWTNVPTAHDRSDGQVVLRPTFTARTPHTQTTTPHYFGWSFTTSWNH